MSFIGAHRIFSSLLVSVILAGCSTWRPWQNLPVTAAAPAPAATPARSIVAAVTLSGGGARAAAFGLGVLQELKATAFTWEGQPTTLLDEVGLITGVSGGSILAAHYAAFGDETLTSFEPAFLQADFEGALFNEAVSGSTLHRLTSPWYGRSNVLADRLDRLYRGRTIGDVQARPRAPELVVSATDLTTGAPFEFTPEQFARICSDVASVPLAYAVAASSAVPILLSPVTLHNHAGRCTQPAPPAAPATDDSYRARLLRGAIDSYADAAERPFIHLVDGGVADNLGVRTLLDRFVATGSFDQSFRDAAPGSIRQLILVTVNAERDIAERIDHSDRVPGTGQVVEALLFGAGARETQVTLAMLNDDLRHWQGELARQRGQHGSPFSKDAQLHVITVSLRDIENPDERGAMLRVPTAFTIAGDDVRRLREAGRRVLRRSPVFQALRRSLQSNQRSGP